MLQRRASRMSVGQNLIHRSNFVRSKKRSSETRKPNWVTENIRLTKQQRLKFATCTSVGDIVLVMFYCSATLNPALLCGLGKTLYFQKVSGEYTLWFLCAPNLLRRGAWGIYKRCYDTLPPNNTDDCPLALFPESVDIVKSRGLLENNPFLFFNIDDHHTHVRGTLQIKFFLEIKAAAQQHNNFLPTSIS